MSLSREQREIIENTYLVSIFEQMEQDVIADIARRVDKTKRYTETAEILARNMRELGFSPAEIQKEVLKSIGADTQLQMEIAENTKQYKQDVAEIIKQTEKDALAAGDMLTAMAGDMSWNDDLQMWAEHGVNLQKDNALKQIVTGVQNMLEGDIKNLTQSTGFIDGDFEDAYQKALDKTFIKMATSTMGYEAAAKECVLELAKSGAVVQYGSGRKYHLDTAVRMCVRTATAKLSGSIMESNMQKTGQDLVYVDAHAGARPEHAEWQGKVFVYNLDEAKKYPEYGSFWDETDYGSVTGLQGVNCMHNWYPYWPGDPIPAFKEPDPVMIDGKEYTYYEATQEQRKQERNIRSLKRQRDAAQALGDDQKVAELNKMISTATGRYRAFSQAANLRPKFERLGNIDKNFDKEVRGYYELVADKNKFFYRLDPLYEYVKKIDPIPGYTDIAIHGDEFSVCIQNVDEQCVQSLNGGQFADWLDLIGEYKGGNIRLLSCKTGYGDGIVPKVLAARYNVNVIAPDENVVVYSDGSFILTNDDYNAKHGIETGHWYIFTPNGGKYLCDSSGFLLENMTK